MIPSVTSVLQARHEVEELKMRCCDYVVIMLMFQCMIFLVLTSVNYFVLEISFVRGNQHSLELSSKKISPKTVDPGRRDLILP